MKTIQEIKTDFEQVLSDLSKISGMTPESSIQVATIILQESGKDRRAEIYNSKNNGFNRNYNSNNNDKPITEKQKKFMQDLGITVTPNMTSREASRLIDQSRSNGKGSNSARSFQK
ncbi:hypothetical protein HZB88_04505 [archaeon]|nr:hypothetical protein [archaeon]